MFNFLKYYVKGGGIAFSLNMRAGGNFLNTMTKRGEGRIAFSLNMRAGGYFLNTMTKMGEERIAFSLNMRVGYW